MGPDTRAFEAAASFESDCRAAYTRYYHSEKEIKHLRTGKQTVKMFKYSRALQNTQTGI
jgi:hypothetical protein